LPALEFICHEVCCNVPLLPLPTEPKRNRHKKAELAEALLEWCLQQPKMQNVGASTSTESGHILQAKEVEEIWSDSDQLLTPTWMTSILAVVHMESSRLISSMHYKQLIYFFL